MTRQVIYRYLGTNGVIESPIHLEDIYYVRVNILTADKDKTLTDGITTQKVVRCADDEIENWREISIEGQN